MLAVTGGFATRAPVKGPTAVYFRQVTRMCAAFSLTADLVLITLGGKFKFKEKLSGRLADILGHLYLATAVLKRFEDDGRPEDDLPLVQWAMNDSLYIIQDRLRGVLGNFPLPGVGALIKWIVFPFGMPYHPPSDQVGKSVARLLLSENESRDRLVSGVYISDGDDAAGKIHSAFHLMLISTNAENAVRNALKEHVSWDNYKRLVKRAVESGVVTEEQATLVRLAQEAGRAAIAVDDFPSSALERSP
jgi:acyl-CoA dehydrogenase